MDAYDSFLKSLMIFPPTGHCFNIEFNRQETNLLPHLRSTLQWACQIQPSFLKEKRIPPPVNLWPLAPTCALFLCMPQWHGNCRKSVWLLSTLSYLQLRWNFPSFFFFNDYVFLFVFLPSNASNTWGEAQRRVTCVNENKRRKAEKKHREAGSTAECGK